MKKKPQNDFFDLEEQFLDYWHKQISRHIHQLSKGEHKIKAYFEKEKKHRVILKFLLKDVKPAISVLSVFCLVTLFAVLNINNLMAISNIFDYPFNKITRSVEKTLGLDSKSGLTPYSGIPLNKNIMSRYIKENNDDWNQGKQLNKVITTKDEIIGQVAGIEEANNTAEDSGKSNPGRQALDSLASGLDYIFSGIGNIFYSAGEKQKQFSIELNNNFNNLLNKIKP